ncbi:response regulator transcription factor [Exilibacterium tricleocarpae]|uniref:Response regulator transcription factor n=1 Tax=Exilibacterium tricleocarpae TaxID=2591008 RepID=A0A545TVB8_9GAMM|nr:response regulator [Exilibacterium tricleocarpae]TQV81154.1 response regulator transcription factor [Exilibacterium tricleocarpae]
MGTTDRATKAIARGTVFIVDDDTAVLNAIDLFLRSHGLQTQIFADAASFLEVFKPHPPQCLLLDVRMPEIDGLALLKTLKARSVSTPVIMLTGHGDVPMAVRAIKLGAYDFFQKPFNDNDLLGCIHKALERDGQTTLPGDMPADVRRRLQELTPRERQVLDGVVAGRQTKVIAAELGLSSRTVDVYRSSMMRKMKTKSPVELLSLLTGYKIGEYEEDNHYQ